MTYLTDVSSDSPAFKVIPQTHTFVPEQGDLRGDDRGFAQLSPSGAPLASVGGVAWLCSQQSGQVSLLHYT